MACRVISTVNITTYFIMQENGTHTGDRYKYKKVVLILDIGMNTEK